MITLMLKKLLTLSPLSVILLFLLVKFSSFSYNFSDTYGYFIAGKYILEGKLLYKDIFMTNLPLFSYVSALYASIFGDNFPMFMRMALIEAALCGVMVWLIVRKEIKSIYIQCLFVGVYLFSAVVLISTEFEMGIMLATLFALTSYYCYKTKHFVLSGIILGLALCTKGYLIGIPVVMLCYDIYKRRTQSLNLVLPFIATVLLVLTPTLFWAREDFIRNLSFTVGRPGNPSRWELQWYFIVENWLAILFLLASFVNFKKNPPLALISGGSYAFLLYFQDVYYYYYNVTLPFMLLGGVELYKSLQKRIPGEALISIFSVLCLLSIILHLQTYSTNFFVRKFENPEKLVKVIKDSKPDVIYGNQDIAALLSLQTGIPLMNGVIDLNPKLFEREIYSTTEFTQNIFKQKTIVILYGGYFNNKNQFVEDGLVDHAVIKAKCKMIYEQKIDTKTRLNRFFVMKCY